MAKNEFKVVKATWKRNIPTLAVIPAPYYVAEPDARMGYLSLDKEDDMFVIAENHDHACRIVKEYWLKSDMNPANKKEGSHDTN